MSVYIGPSPRKGEKREMTDGSKTIQTTPTRTHRKRSWPLPHHYPNQQDVPALEVYTALSHHHSANGIQREIKVKGQKLGTVTSFKYLGAVVSDDGSKPEVLSRIAQATAAITKLKPIGRDNNVSLGSKVKLMRSLVISIFLYVCESWT